MANQLSGIAIILFIAFGSLTFILLFIFAKRQITRFALKNRHGPHASIAVDAPKKLRLEIERRLDATHKIQGKPWLLNGATKDFFVKEDICHLTPLHLYRMKVVDDVKELSNLMGSKNSSLAKRFRETTIQYFLRMRKTGAMPNLDVGVLCRFLVMYENARHRTIDFGYTEYLQFIPLLKIVKNEIQKLNCSPNNHMKTKMREEEVLMDESATPLLNRSKSCLEKDGPSMRKLAHETTV